MNGILAMIVIAGACYIVCVRLSPLQMRWWADFLRARADAEDFWRLRFDFYKKETAKNGSYRPIDAQSIPGTE